MNIWIKYADLRDAISVILDSRSGDQTPPSRSQILDSMVAVCAIAGPEETLSEKTEDFSSAGHVVIYERWGDSPCECDGWILSLLQDETYDLTKIGAPQNCLRFDPGTIAESLDPVYDLLERTYWRPLNWSAFLRG